MAPEQVRNVRNKLITITLTVIFMIKKLLKFAYENFRYTASELKDVGLNQLLSEIADKLKKCVNLFETVKDKLNYS